MKKISCCFCGNETQETEQRKPDPVDIGENSICCQECFIKIVLPARFVIRALLESAGTGERLSTVRIPDFPTWNNLKKTTLSGSKSLESFHVRAAAMMEIKETRSVLALIEDTYKMHRRQP